MKIELLTQFAIDLDILAQSDPEATFQIYSRLSAYFSASYLSEDLIAVIDDIVSVYIIVFESINLSIVLYQISDRVDIIYAFKIINIIEISLNLVRKISTELANILEMDQASFFYPSEI